MALDRHMYDDPMLVLERKQQAALNKKKNQRAGGSKLPCGNCVHKIVWEFAADTINVCKLTERPCSTRCVSFKGVRHEIR